MKLHVSTKSARLFAATLLSGTLLSAQDMRKVDCGSQSLSRAVQQAQSGDTLLVTGICRAERIVITTDRLTLDGQGAAILDLGFGSVAGGASDATVLIDGARGVVFRGFTIQNGPTGILGQSNAGFKVQNATIQNNLEGVVASDGSIAEISDSMISNNNDGGVTAVNGSVIRFVHSVKVDRNVGIGVGAFSSSVIEVRGALEANSNGDNGIFLSGASLNIFQINESLASSITANNNTHDGIFLGGGQAVFQSPPFARPGDKLITAAGNGGSGINLAGFASLVSLTAARYVMQGNSVGLNVGSESSVLILGGLDVEGNGTGILADGAGSLTIGSIPPLPSMIRDNRDADVDLSFGTRILVAGATIGNLKCDATVLSNGTTTCPAERTSVSKR